MNTAVAIPMTTLPAQGMPAQIGEGMAGPFPQIPGQARSEVSFEAFKSFLNEHVQRLRGEGEKGAEAMFGAGMTQEELDALIEAAASELGNLEQLMRDGALDADKLKQALAGAGLDVEALEQMLADGALDADKLKQMLADGTLDAAELKALLAASAVPSLSPSGKTLPGAETKTDARGGNLPEGKALMRLVELMEKGVVTPPALRAEAEKAEGGQDFLLRARELAALLPAAREDALKPAEHLLRQASAGTTEQTGQAIPLMTAAESERSTQSQVQTPQQALRMDVPLGRPGWDQALGNRVMWMLNQKTQSAELQLNPAHLGPVKVDISLEGDRANVHFVAHHGVTRDAIDAAIPRLREMLADSGVNLGQVNVSSQGAGDPRGGPLARESGGDGQYRGSSEGDGTETLPESTRVSAEGLVDYYA